MPGANPNLINPGDIVWLDSRILTPTRGAGQHTWPHKAICLFHHYQGTIPDLIVSKTIFHFVCISSITNANPFDASKQVFLNHLDPNLGLDHPSAVCVDFAPTVQVTIEGKAYVLDGVQRLTNPVVNRVPLSPTL